MLLAGSRIAHIGALDEQKLVATGLDCAVIDVTGCVVTPGFIDPHEHLIGAGGEEGFASRMPEILFVDCLHTHGWSLAELLPLFTSNPAKILQLPSKGVLAKGNDADILVLDRATFAIVHLFARGRQIIKAGALVAPSKQEEQIAAGKE